MKFLYAAGNESKTVTVTQKRTLYIKESDVTLTEAGKDSALTLMNTEARAVSWTSSNTGVVTVNAGKVRAVADGTAVITVRSSDGKYYDTCNITVEIPEPVEEEPTDDDETSPDDEPSSVDGSSSDGESAGSSDSGKSSDDNASARTRKKVRLEKTPVSSGVR